MHEIAHISQSLNSGGLNFKGGLLINAGKNIIDVTKNEIEGYRTQFSLDGSFPGTQTINNVFDINVHTIGNLNIEGAFTYEGIKKYSDYLRGRRKTY